MSTIVPMPERVKPPPADTGEIISPGCASFEIATPSNGARTVMSARSVRCWFTRLSRHLHLLLGKRDPRLDRLHLRPRRVQLGPPDHLLLEQLLTAAEGQLRLAQPCLVLGCAAPRGLELRFGDRERRPHLRVVEPREHLPLPDRLAFLDEDFEDLAGDLRRHRRPSPRRHVPGGVQHGAGGRAGPGPRGHGCRRDRRRIDARGPEPAAGGDRNREECERNPHAAAASARARGLVDTE